MKILITGSNGFIGKNLIERIRKEMPDSSIYEFDINNSIQELEDFCKDCGFVFNLAAVHRPKDNKDFFSVNTYQFSTLLNFLEKHHNKCPVLYTSSIQSNNGSDYGRSKFLGEKLLFDYGKKTGARSIVYQLTNVFGKWAKPNSHSVVATFCYNVARDIPLYISDRNIEMKFLYIDDVIDSFIARIKEGRNPTSKDKKLYIIKENIISISLGELADLIRSFKMRKDDAGLTKNERLFYLTYLSYKEENENDKKI